MVAHKHAEMIKAKADNMELVVFENDQHGKDNWYVIGDAKLPVNSRYSYFLCLPQHKEAFLHWLNGGLILINSDGYHVNNHTMIWHKNHHFMSKSSDIRIKPRKEKRYVVITDGLAMPRLLKECDLDGAREIISNASFYEIEVEA